MLIHRSPFATNKCNIGHNTSSLVTINATAI
jgi:hypothetical protein